MFLLVLTGKWRPYIVFYNWLSCQHLPCVWLGVGASWVGLDPSLRLFGWNPRWVELAPEGIFAWDAGWFRPLKSGGRSEPPFLRRERRDRPTPLARTLGKACTWGGVGPRQSSPARPPLLCPRTEVEDKGHRRNLVSLSGPLCKSAMAHRFYRSGLV